MKVISRVLLSFAALAFVGLTSGSVYADNIVFVGPDIQKLVPPLAALNLQHHGNNTAESGGVRFTGSGDQSFGDISAGPHQHTVTFGQLGISRASQLFVLLNINEANGGDKAPIILDSLVLTAFDQSGNTIFSTSLNGPLNLDQFRHGQGSNSDFAFGLDAEAAAQLQAAFDSNPNLRLGLTASLSNVNGGPERFKYSGGPAAVPEPTTMVLLGTGLAGLAAAARRRRKAAAAENQRGEDTR